MKICLVNAAFPPSLWDFSGCKEIGGYKYPFPPLSLLTLAGLTPKEHEITIMDENTGRIDFETEADLIGITGTHIQKERIFEIADFFRRRGIKVAIGGPILSGHTLDECLLHADTVFIGEAERTWPGFLKELLEGRHGRVYSDDTWVDLSLSAMPRFDLVNLRDYSTALVETSRGCPFSCEFCEVPLRLGRIQRTKSVKAVMQEVEYLYLLGADSVFFVDDNLIGKRARTMELLRGLASFVKSIDYKMHFTGNVTLNLAKDKELLSLFREANFKRVFIGIETPREETLMSVNKRQNLGYNPVEAVHTITSHGMMVWGSFVVGFDNDDKNVFGEILDLINRSEMPIAMVGPLQAIPGTPLYERIKKQGRLINSNPLGVRAEKKGFFSTNIVSSRMRAQDISDGLKKLAASLYEVDNFKKRLISSIRRFKDCPKSAAGPIGRQNIFSVLRLLKYYLLTTDTGRIRMFLDVCAELIKHHEHIHIALNHLAVYKHMKSFFYEDDHLHH